MVGLVVPNREKAPPVFGDGIKFKLPLHLAPLGSAGEIGPQDQEARAAGFPVAQDEPLAIFGQAAGLSRVAPSGQLVLGIEVLLVEDRARLDVKRLQRATSWPIDDGVKG